MAKQRSQFVCQQCGAISSKWSGKCENCGEWNSLVEQVVESSGASAVSKSSRNGRQLESKKLNDVGDEKTTTRLKTEIDDLDEVLGGGFLPGGIVLLAGQPGIGKSTLLTQIAATIGRDKKVLYVSGEESVQQISMRAKRLGSIVASNLELASSNEAEDIAASIRSGNYD